MPHEGHKLKSTCHGASRIEKCLEAQTNKAQFELDTNNMHLWRPKFGNIWSMVKFLLEGVWIQF
jgi:hypothetical protein